MFLGLMEEGVGRRGCVPRLKSTCEAPLRYKMNGILKRTDCFRIHEGIQMSTNHFHVLAKDDLWTVTLDGLHVTTCGSRTEAYHEAVAKAGELGSGEIYVHDPEGDLAWHESVPKDPETH